MSFAVNDKVVLVDDKWNATVLSLYDNLPKLNETYVVRAVRVGVKADELIQDMRRVLEPSVLLVGLFNRSNNLGVEAGFAAHRFRKLDEVQAKNAERETVGAGRDLVPVGDATITDVEGHVWTIKKARFV